MGLESKVWARLYNIYCIIVEFILFCWLDYVWYEILVGQLGPPLWHTFAIGPNMCLITNWDHAILIEVCSTTKQFHMWLHCCCESLSRTIVLYVLWYNICILRWWVLVLSWIIARGSFTNSLEMGNILQHGFNSAPCICLEWGKNLGSLGCHLPRDKWYDAYHKNYIWPYTGLGKT